VVEITFLYRSVPDQLDRYPIATRPYTNGFGREELSRVGAQSSSGRVWSGNLGDRDDRVDLIGSGNWELRTYSFMCKFPM